MVFDDVGDICYNHVHDDNNNDQFDTRKFHKNAPETDIHVDNDDDEEFNGIKFHAVSKNYGRVRDHCYYTGKYIGTAHSICNLRYKTPKEIPAVFHNQ